MNAILSNTHTYIYSYARFLKRGMSNGRRFRMAKNSMLSQMRRVLFIRHLRKFTIDTQQSTDVRLHKKEKKTE